MSDTKQVRVTWTETITQTAVITVDADDLDADGAHKHPDILDTLLADQDGMGEEYSVSDREVDDWTVLDA